MLSYLSMRIILRLNVNIADDEDERKRETG